MDFFLFSIFSGGHFGNGLEHEVHPKIFLLTMQILILDAVCFHKNIVVVVVWGGVHQDPPHPTAYHRVSWL